MQPSAIRTTYLPRERPLALENGSQWLGANFLSHIETNRRQAVLALSSYGIRRHILRLKKKK